MYSEAAEELLIATLAQETLGGCYVKQVKGPAVGIYQCEPRTYDSLWMTYISQDPQLVARILNANQYIQQPPAEHLIWNIKLATMIARIHYRQVREPLPAKDDIEGLWKYYKIYYNSNLGSATHSQFIRNYHMFLGADWDTSSEPRSHIIVSSVPVKAVPIAVKKDK